MSRTGTIILLTAIFVAGIITQAVLVNAGIDENYLTMLITVVVMTLTTRLRSKDTVMNGIFQLLAGLLIIVLVNFIGSKVHHKFDLTAEKRHTLSENTQQMLDSLEDVILVKVYLEGEFSADYKKLRKAIEEKLDIYRSYSDGRIEYTFINPGIGTDEEVSEMYKQLHDFGLEEIQENIEEGGAMGQRLIWPGAVVSYRGNNVPINFISHDAGAYKAEFVTKAINDLEFNITNALQKLFVQKSRIAFIEGHGELEAMQLFDITRSLKEFYEVERVNINGQLKALEGYDLIIIAKPDSTFGDKDKFIIDQFIMNGGSSMWLVDPTDCSMDSIYAGASVAIGMSRPLNIEDQLFRYGVRLNNNVVMDLSASKLPLPEKVVGGEVQFALKPWYYYPLVQPISSHPIVRNLDPIRTQFISTIDTVGSPAIKKTILLHSSRYSRIENAPIRISLRKANMPANQQMFNKSFFHVGALLEGQFESLYKNVLPDAMSRIPNLEVREKSLPTKMIVVADGDLIANGVREVPGQAPQAGKMGLDAYEGRVYANRSFILNAISYLLDDSGLIGIRNRDTKIRVLDSTIVKEQTTKIQLLTVLLPLGIILLFALTQIFVRRHAYASPKKPISPGLFWGIMLVVFVGLSLLLFYQVLPWVGWVGFILMELVLAWWCYRVVDKLFVPEQSS